jgi:hypothetical protein
MNLPDQLNPCRVIQSFLLQLPSFEVPKIVDKSGLEVNWDLTKEQNFSDKYRIATYRTRIDTALENLTDENKLRFAYVVVKELVKRGIGTELEEALQNIGWRLQDNELKPDSIQITELFFTKGSQHDAYVEIRSIFKSAKSSIDIVDSYIDGKLLKILGENLNSTNEIRILTSKTPPDINSEMSNWKKQYSTVTLEIRKSKEFHDRFIVIDNKLCWHVGCSIKDIGDKAFMLSKIEDKLNYEALICNITKTWKESAVI